MIIIDKYAYNSKIAGYKLSGKLIFAGVPLLLCLFSTSTITNAAVTASMAMATIYWGSMSAGRYLKLLIIPMGFIFIGITAIIITGIGGDQTNIIAAVDLAGYKYGVTYESLGKGILIAMRSIGAISCFYFIALNTPMNSIFAFLQRRKVPQLLVDLMELIYRFIFIIWDEWKRIYTAQASRLGYRNLSSSMRSTGELVTMLFVNCLNRAERINLALESRGFNGSFGCLSDDAEAVKTIVPHGVALSLLLLAAEAAGRLI